MTTSSRFNSGAYDTLWTNTLELWKNDPKNSFEDLVFLQTPTMAVFRSAAMTRPLPHTIAVRINEHRGTGAGPFEYYDTLNTDPQRGTQAANFQVAQYAAPLTLSDQEKLELDTPEKLADHADFVMKLQSEELSQLIAKDIFRGTATNSKNMIGLEQIMPATSHVTAAGGTANGTQPLLKRFQMKQNASAFGGITRGAWTDDDATGGTYWEPNVVNMYDDTITFDSSGLPTDGLKRMTEARSLATYGIEKPNVMFSDFQPYNDYKNAAMSKERITRSGGSMIDANVTFENIVFDGMPWFWDDLCYSHTADEDATVNESNIYMINTKKIQMEIDSRWNFEITEKRSPVDQLATTQHIVFRGQLVCCNPRSSVRLFNYGS